MSRNIAIILPAGASVSLVPVDKIRPTVYDLNYWRDKNNGAIYKLDKKAKEEIKETLKNMKSSKNNP